MMPKAEEKKEDELNPLENERLQRVFEHLSKPWWRICIVDQTKLEKDKEYEDECSKIEAKYKVEEDIKRDDKDKKKSERLKKKEAEKSKLKEKGLKITEGDLMKILETLDPKSKPKITDVRDMIWVL